jgi:hypothetical protein
MSRANRGLTNAWPVGEAALAKLKKGQPLTGAIQREVNMGFLIPAAMITMVVILAVTLTRL